MRTAIVTLLALIPVLPAEAAFVDYQITFTVTSGVGYDCGTTEEEWQEGCTEFDPTGNVYYGSFGIDDSLLATDGLNKPGVLSHFIIQMEGNIWAAEWINGVRQFHPTNNSLMGFYGPEGFNVVPGFDVIGGQVVDIRGGVYGSGDEPLVDLSGWDHYSHEQVEGCLGFFCGVGTNVFKVSGNYQNSLDGRYLLAQGTMHITPVPVPTAAWLFMGAVGALTGLRRIPMEK